MNEPHNAFGIGKYHGSVALGKGLHRMMSSKQALDVAYWLIKTADKDTQEQVDTLSLILELVLQNAREEEQI